MLRFNPLDIPCRQRVYSSRSNLRPWRPSANLLRLESCDSEGLGKRWNGYRTRDRVVAQSRRFEVLRR